MKRIMTAEWVFPGHPDKLADAIADSIVEKARDQRIESLVGVEVAVNRNNVTVTGRVGSNGTLMSVSPLVRDVYRRAGYSEEWYPSPDALSVTVDLCQGELLPGEAEFRAVSDDQTISIGYANDIEATNHLPIEQWLVRNLAKRIYETKDESLCLGPDGKVILQVEETEEGRKRSWRLLHVSASLQQKDPTRLIDLNRFVRQCAKAECERLNVLLPEFSAEIPEHILVNGAGNFAVGGPEGDNGLSGKKLVCDAYGPRIPIGGGAWSGKDFFKADRAGGLFARKVAKTIVHVGLAKEATVMLSYFPGDREARVLSATDEKGNPIDCQGIVSLMDLSLQYSGTHFAVPNLPELARWGHFFKTDAPWEQIEIR